MCKSQVWPQQVGERRTDTRGKTKSDRTTHRAAPYGQLVRKNLRTTIRQGLMLSERGDTVDAE